MTASSFFSPVVAGLVPYVPGEQPHIDNLVKLNTNENPYPPSPKVVAAITAAAREGLQLYPDPQSLALKCAIAAHHGLEVRQVFVGNGSDEVLAHAFFTFFQHGSALLMPDITYSFYQVYCGLYGIPFELVPLDADLRVSVHAFEPAVQREVAGIVVANPNAPTGIGLPVSEIEKLLQMLPHRVVLVDEAYVDFGGETAMGLVAKYPNLLVVHTLSKSRSLAGLRVGFACGQASLIEALDRVKDSFNSYPLDRLAIAGGVAAMEDRAYFESTRQAIVDTRTTLVRQLEELGFDVLPSQANFVFARHSRYDATQLAVGLRDRAVLVRHFKLSRIEQFLRISIGTPAQSATLIGALREVLAA